MRTRGEVSDDKLRGGFYSPDVLVDMCLARSRELLAQRTGLRVLEPAAGDGAFLRGIARNDIGRDVESIEAVEIFEDEAQKAAQILTDHGLPGRVLHENVLDWATRQPGDFDLVLANPPYVRFQFITDADKQLAKSISAELGVTGSSVSNLWIPVFLLSLAKLRPGGVFSVILPTEFLTGISAKTVRNWLLTKATDLSIDLFKPGSFPSVLQEVLVLTGRVSEKHAATPTSVTFHDHNGGTRSWSHVVSSSAGTWTNYLLSPVQNNAFEAVRSMPGVVRLSEIARFTVSTVTGANGYFCVDSDTLAKYELAEWAVPLLPRARHAKGLIFDQQEQQDLAEGGRPAWLIHFAANKPAPEEFAGPRAYLAHGERQEIHRRFKCRVREPWYRVPVVPAGSLFLSKRSNRFPRVIANHARTVTTDTIYRGQISAGSPATADDFTATFHNSLTMLSAEVEGRSFGGGVLELVPSEVNALQVPMLPGAGANLEELDRVARTASDPEELILATDAMLTRLVPELDATTMSALGEARMVLMDRRLQRTYSTFYSDEELASV